MTEQPPPARKPIQCQCIIIRPDTNGWRNRCYEGTPGPDVPFCPQCEDRHVGMVEAEPGLVVTVVPIPSMKEGQ